MTDSIPCERIGPFFLCFLIAKGENIAKEKTMKGFFITTFGFLFVAGYILMQRSTDEERNRHVPKELFDAIGEADCCISGADAMLRLPNPSCGKVRALVTDIRRHITQVTEQKGQGKPYYRITFQQATKSIVLNILFYKTPLIVLKKPDGSSVTVDVDDVFAKRTFKANRGDSL